MLLNGTEKTVTTTILFFSNKFMLERINLPKRCVNIDKVPAFSVVYTGT